MKGLVGNMEEYNQEIVKISWTEREMNCRAGYSQDLLASTSMESHPVEGAIQGNLNKVCPRLHKQFLLQKVQSC